MNNIETSSGSSLLIEKNDSGKDIEYLKSDHTTSQLGGVDTNRTSIPLSEAEIMLQICDYTLDYIEFSTQSIEQSEVGFTCKEEISLSSADYMKFQECLESPPQPNENLINLFKKFSK